MTLVPPPHTRILDSPLLSDIEHATTTFSPTTRWQHHKFHQFHLLLHSADGSTTTPTATQLSQFKVCDTFHSTKTMTHFIAQSLHVPAHKQSGQHMPRVYAAMHMHAAHRFLDIQIISNKLGVAPLEHRATPSYSNVYKPISTSRH
ncbi:hypothetical protein AVEN_159667-1 [Araneus ventricosus]|uniref:Uncharacterized protein n=1 Tax=Araneus ventricosus TaxID=182803 RepID=A0A4Y2FHZ3_ARAVE|nr:hypothetical protein AVEN_159667-1 [Araneus ventricosus]